ncbi:MAG: asparagine synthase (glutamine-hydrolyzing) [Myxococcota bacterium]
MSGIVGLLRRDEEEVDEGLLRKMSRLIAHRGPDGVDIVRKANLGMALSRAGQPTLAARGPLAAGGAAFLILDGEITDRSPCERALARKGRISLGTDAEILLDALEAGGVDLLAELDGAFAFAAWWPSQQRLLLARDRFGAKPLYFTYTPVGLYFASEMKALLAAPDVSRRLDPKGLDQVLTFWSTIAPRTILEGIEELPPAHFLEARGSSRVMRRYWRLELGGPTIPKETEGAATWLYKELDASVRRRLRPPGPVGSYVSGGLDSTLVTCLAAGLLHAPISTFSVSFSHAAYDESLEQRRVVKYVHSNHSSLPCSPEDVGRIFPELMRHVETPLIRTAPAPLLLLARQARRAGVRAVLTGEGADELLGGYDLFKEVKVRSFCAAQPGSNLRPNLFKRLYPYLPAIQAMPAPMLASFYGARPEDLEDPFFSHRPRWSVTSSLKRLYHPDLRCSLAGYDPVEELAATIPADFYRWSPFCRAQYLEAAVLLPSLLALQGDRVAMASGLATRTPFLDKRVVDVAMALPVSLKMRGLREKYLLRRADRSFVPDELRARPKQPYRAPQASCFPLETRDEELAWVSEMLSEQRVQRDGIFNPKAVSTLAAKLRSGAELSARDDMAVVAVLSTGLVFDQLVTSFGRWFHA